MGILCLTAQPSLEWQRWGTDLILDILPSSVYSSSLLPLPFPFYSSFPVIAYSSSQAPPLLLCLISFSRSSFLPLTTSFLSLPHLHYPLLLPFVLHFLLYLCLPFYLLPSYFVSSSPALPLFLLYLHLHLFSTFFSPSLIPLFLFNHLLSPVASFLPFHLMFFHLLLYILHLLYIFLSSSSSAFHFWTLPFFLNLLFCLLILPHLHC